MLNINDQPLLPQNKRPILGIGAGGIVHDAHLPAYQLAGFEVVGLYDKLIPKAEALAQKFAIPQVFSSLENAIANAPENVVFDIAVPANFILEILPSLPDHATVLIQKPMGENLADARQIRQICRQKHLTAAINFQLRFSPPLIAAQHLIQAGHLGEIHDVEIRVTAYTPWHLWEFLEKIDRVEILYHSIHYVDLIRALLGNPQGIYAKTVKHPKMMNMAGVRSNIIMDYGDVLRANILTHHGHEGGQKYQEGSIKIEGTKGAVKIQMGVILNYPHGEPDQFEYCFYGGDQTPQWHLAEIQGTWFPHAFIGSMASVMRKAEGSSEKLPTSIEDAFATMACVEAAYQSSATGAIPLDLSEF